MSIYQKKMSIVTSNAPAPVGAYSQAVAVNGLLFVSGQIGINPKTGLLVNASFESESKQVLDNIKQVLIAAGAGFNNVVKMTVFLTDMNQFSVFNTLYETCFEPPYPARALVEVSRLPKGACVEAEAVVQL